MAILGTLIKKGIRIRESLDQEFSAPADLQKAELRKLMISARNTKFGQHYQFKNLLKAFKNNADPLAYYREYAKTVPIHNYNKMHDEWWHLNQKGQRDVCWPGKVKYFALSSGTSEASSKYIPVTREMKKAIQKTSIRQILTLSHYDLPGKIFQSGILMLGGSTHLNKEGSYFSGDLSGIQAAQLPFWFQHFYKPGKKISKTKDWESKLEEITHKAKDWNIGIIVGVPAWIQILLEKIIEHYKVAHIHEVWPSLQIYVHGGVSFEPYRKGFEALLGRELTYIETYLASEGFIGFQAKPNVKSMRMVMNNGLFYEYVPFEDSNFDENGDLLPGAKTLTVGEVEEGKDYALLLSSCAGAWRYLIGDVIRFVSMEESEIIITGRTKHFLSLCGEHLSVDNMNRAINLAARDLGISIKEFAVAGIPYGSLFAHQWYIGSDDPVDRQNLKTLLDGHLEALNDDYKVERSAALKEIFVEVLPNKVFYDWMESKGEVGGQHKFPRVLKKAQLDEWQEFIKTHH